MHQTLCLMDNQSGSPGDIEQEDVLNIDHEAKLLTEAQRRRQALTPMKRMLQSLDNNQEAKRSLVHFRQAGFSQDHLLR
jgi:hypothetical protein